eukprot:292198_1
MFPTIYGTKIPIRTTKHVHNDVIKFNLLILEEHFPCTMCSTFVKSDKLPISCIEYIPKPSQHPTNKDCIIISTNYYETKTTPGIYQYDIQTNELQIIYKYNTTFKLYFHGQFIDTSNNTLILYGGRNHIFEIFDLNTN